MTKKTTLKSYRHGLRQTYLLLSALVSIVIISATIFSSLHITDVTTQNTSSLKLQETVSSLVSEIRRNISTSNTALDELLLSPANKTNAEIIKYIANTESKLQELTTIPRLEETGLLPLINAMNNQISKMHSNIIKLLNLRQDPQWTYPALTIMSRDMLENNALFTSSIELIMHDLQNESDINNKQFAFLNKLVSIRDSWRLMVLNFRAALMRFADLIK